MTNLTPFCRKRSASWARLVVEVAWMVPKKAMEVARRQSPWDGTRVCSLHRFGRAVAGTVVQGSCGHVQFLVSALFARSHNCECIPHLFKLLFAQHCPACLRVGVTRKTYGYAHGCMRWLTWELLCSVTTKPGCHLKLQALLLQGLFHRSYACRCRASLATHNAAPAPRRRPPRCDGQWRCSRARGASPPCTRSGAWWIGPIGPVRCCRNEQGWGRAGQSGSTARAEQAPGWTG
jgi:hypothetical protein